MKMRMEKHRNREGQGGKKKKKEHGKERGKTGKTNHQIYLFIGGGGGMPVVPPPPPTGLCHRYMYVREPNFAKINHQRF